MPKFSFTSAVALLAASTFAFAAEPAPGAQGVNIVQSNDSVRVEINGELFTQYWFKGKQHLALMEGKDGITKTNPTKHVYFFPVMGPGGVSMTRSWPMVNGVPGEEIDGHPHHRGLWFAHGKVNGVDFWGEVEKSGKIVHDQFLEMKGGKDEGVIKSSSKWIAPDGKVVCFDERTARFYNRPANERVMDFEITIKALPDRDALFGDTKEGTMAIRVNEEMRVTRGKKQPGTGHIVLSTGIRDDAPPEKGETKTWGKRADWCDYYGKVGGKTVGIAIFNHPSNPVSPTPWHVRDYGLFAANPFGIHDFEKKEAGAGNLTVPAGKSITFKYRIYIHEGDEQSAKVAERYKEYVAQVK
ncbi:MAG TPA: PmoA family protein [Candidatus Acidoferrum sp.]|nr:PmoA family protein [Candidatus Acidoferrum sp.]